MSAITAFVRRIFGGKSAEGNTAWNTANQADGETLAVGTFRRVFKGPRSGGTGMWSYHGTVTSAAGATSTLKFYYSNLPNPDPTNAAHWIDSGITPIDMTSTTPFQSVKSGVFYEHIKAEAVVATSGGAMWLWVKVEGIEEN